MIKRPVPLTLTARRTPSRLAYWRTLLACLDVDLRLEAGNDKAMVAVREGWRAESELPVSPCGLALIKATMATTFALTLDPTPDRCQAIDARLSAVLIWAQDGAAPARLATFD